MNANFLRLTNVSNPMVPPGTNLIYVNNWKVVPPGIKGVAHLTEHLSQAIDLARAWDIIVVWEGAYVDNIHVLEGRGPLTIQGTPGSRIYCDRPIHTESPVLFCDLNFITTPDENWQPSPPAWLWGIVDPNFNHPATAFENCTFNMTRQE